MRVVFDARVEVDRQRRRIERGDRRAIGASGDGVLHGEGRGTGEQAVPRQDRPARPGDFRRVRSPNTGPDPSGRTTLHRPRARGPVNPAATARAHRIAGPIPPLPRRASRLLPRRDRQ
ncbi:MAG: hypothetical protein ACK53T_14655 [Planctomycetota bacterium]